jgi:hypothetical protein
MYAAVQGVPQDHVEAAKWFRKAAEQGNAGAQYNLATAYANGEGVSKDYVQAYMWFMLAAAQAEDDKPRNLVVEELRSGHFILDPIAFKLRHQGKGRAADLWLRRRRGGERSSSGRLSLILCGKTEGGPALSVRREVRRGIGFSAVSGPGRKGRPGDGGPRTHDARPDAWRQ